MTPIEKVIATATAEIGYIEKATNAMLDSKTGNAGSGNWTKYARDLDNIGNIYNGKKNGYAWCDIWTDWVFITTFGVETGMKLLCQPYNGGGAGCTYSAQYYKNKWQFHTKNPKPGDQIFFTNDGGKTSNHTGIVVKVDSSKVYTIEGNTSSAAGVDANGGCVRDKSYDLNYYKIMGYGRPDYSIVPCEDSKDATAGTAVKVDSAAYRDDSLAGAYKTTSDLNMRAGANTSKAVLVVVPNGGVVRNYGYYSTQDGTIGGKKWLYVQYITTEKTYTGFCSSLYLTKI